MATVHITVGRRVRYAGREFVPGENIPLYEEDVEEIVRLHPDSGVRITKTVAEVCGPHHLASDEDFRAHLRKVGADPKTPHPCPHREEEV